jgi:hypothetical protein
MPPQLAEALSRLGIEFRVAREMEIDRLIRRVLVLRPFGEEVLGIENGNKAVLAFRVALQESEEETLKALPESSRSFVRDALLREMLFGRTEPQVKQGNVTDMAGPLFMSLHQTIILEVVDQPALQRLHDALVELQIIAARCRLALGMLRDLSYGGAHEGTDKGMFA